MNRTRDMARIPDAVPAHIYEDRAPIVKFLGGGYIDLCCPIHFE